MNIIKELKDIKKVFSGKPTEQRRVTKKPSSVFLAAEAAPPEIASSPRPRLMWSTFDHTWAQVQCVEDMPSPLPYRVYKLPVSVQAPDFTVPKLWDWRIHPGVALLK